MIRDKFKLPPNCLQSMPDFIEYIRRDKDISNLKKLTRKIKIIKVFREFPENQRRASSSITCMKAPTCISKTHPGVSAFSSR